MAVGVLVRPKLAGTDYGGASIGLMMDGSEILAPWYVRIPFRRGTDPLWLIPADVCPGGGHSIHRGGGGMDDPQFCQTCGLTPVPPRTGPWWLNGYRIWDSDGYPIRSSSFKTLSVWSGDSVSLKLGVW